MDALTLLADQHTEVDELIEQIEEADDAETQMELFAELADNIAAHSEIEERLFYPSVKADDTQDLLTESAEEHQEVKRILAELMALEEPNEEFTTKLAALKLQLQHHAHEEEEGKLFPLVRKRMDANALETLGAELEQLFDELLEEDPREDVPAQMGSPPTV